MVTAGPYAAPVGMTVNAFATVSLNPMLLLVCLRNGCRMLDALDVAETFAVTVLAQDQEDVARRFADPARPDGPGAFAGLDIGRTLGGCTILLAGVAYFECAVATMHTAGDHKVVIGEVCSLGVLQAKPPLLFLDSTFGV